MTIIGLCGFQGAGKDTLATILINEHNFIKLSFANAVKYVLSIIFGWDRQILEGLTPNDRIFRETIDTWWSQELRMDVTPRNMMQYIGTELFRNHLHEDIWTKVVEKQLIKLLDENKNVVITDCRYPNEFEMVKKYGGKIVHIYRTVTWYENYKATNELPNHIHSSEIAWLNNDFDHVIINNGSIDELKDKLNQII